MLSLICRAPTRLRARTAASKDVGNEREFPASLPELGQLARLNSLQSRGERQLCLTASMPRDLSTTRHSPEYRWPTLRGPTDHCHVTSAKNSTSSCGEGPTRRLRAVVCR